MKKDKAPKAVRPQIEDVQMDPETAHPSTSTKSTTRDKKSSKKRKSHEVDFDDSNSSPTVKVAKDDSKPDMKKEKRKKRETVPDDDGRPGTAGDSTMEGIEPPKEKKKERSSKRSKGKNGEVELSKDDDMTLETGELVDNLKSKSKENDKEKKSKRRKAPKVDDAEESAPVLKEDLSPEKKNKRKKRRKQREDDTDPAGGHQAKKDKKTKEMVVDQAQDATNPDMDVDSTPSPVKKKKEKKPKPDLTDSTATSTSKPKKKSSKRKSNTTGFLDPEDDTQLSEQARKALSYAFLQHHSPSEWKFNKARQNWLVRNVFNIDLVPDSHLPLVLKYLTDVKGGTRSKLIQTCRDLISEAKATTPAPALQQEPSAQDDQPKSILKPALKQSREEADAREAKRSRAEKLLPMLESTSTSTVAEPSDSE
ncbi:hypothetical protein BDN72DRAFT_954670 [Pluteus cervinus]|uniref:Uncharacterized protein n=1 Tax=Pluteus cervinus TaxID=181527 RepID=A0ACD3BCU3_9AGAR|nr:hypothetical protein BDN72DRAFT_954670 [Pluteus cervinus]